MTTHLEKLPNNPLLRRRQTGRNLIDQLLIIAMVLVLSSQTQAQNYSAKWPEKFDLVLQHTLPLEHNRGQRLPLYLWPALDPGPLLDKDAETLVKELNDRGIALFGAWKKNDRENSLK